MITHKCLQWCDFYYCFSKSDSLRIIEPVVILERNRLSFFAIMFNLLRQTFEETFVLKSQNYQYKSHFKQKLNFILSDPTIVVINTVR